MSKKPSAIQNLLNNLNTLSLEYTESKELDPYIVKVKDKFQIEVPMDAILALVDIFDRVAFVDDLPAEEKPVGNVPTVCIGIPLNTFGKDKLWIIAISKHYKDKEGSVRFEITNDESYVNKLTSDYPPPTEEE